MVVITDHDDHDQRLQYRSPGFSFPDRFRSSPVSMQRDSWCRVLDKEFFSWNWSRGEEVDMVSWEEAAGLIGDWFCGGGKGVLFSSGGREYRV